MDEPEVHTPHVPHKKRRRAAEGLPRWLELTIAVTALITSVSSIFIAIKHGQTMEKLVEANSVPYLEGGFSTASPEGAQVISLDLLNRGVGPAHEESIRVTVDGRPVKSFGELVTASIGSATGAQAVQTFEQTHTYLSNPVPKRFVPAGQSQFVFKLPRTPENARWWDMLAKQQPRWDVSFCYCSVFDDCWVTHAKLADDKPVKQCTREDATEFMP